MILMQSSALLAKAGRLDLNFNSCKNISVLTATILASCN